MHFFRDHRSQEGDSFVPNPEGSDIIIAVMGPTGCGKSTFINTLVGEDVALVGHGLQSQTSQVQHYTFSHPHYPQHRIFIVDTPGSSATYTSDVEILRRITNWLARSYKEGMKLAGIIYLHDVSHKRMEGSKRMDYEVFEKLCGGEGATKVVLATTMWGEINESIGETRERELKDDFWNDMFTRGSTVHRMQLTKESTLKILESVLSHGFTGGVAIQREMIDEQKDFTSTKAYNRLKQYEPKTGGMQRCVERLRNLFR